MHSQTALINGMPHSLICPLQIWMCWGKTIFLRKEHSHELPAQIWNQTFSFLFVSCRLFLKRKLLALQITISIDLNFFLTSMSIIFIAPSSIHPSILLFSLTTQSLFCHWCVREKRTGERRRRKRRRKRGRWPAFYLSVFLSCVCPGMALWKMTDLSHIHLM